MNTENQSAVARVEAQMESPNEKTVPIDVALQLAKELDEMTRIQKTTEEVWHGAEAELNKTREERTTLQAELVSVKDLVVSNDLKRLAQLEKKEQELTQLKQSLKELEADKGRLLAACVQVIAWYHVESPDIHWQDLTQIVRQCEEEYQRQQEQQPED